MIQNLSKENFNELHDAYPGAVEFFMQWFEEYKNEVNWEGLFGNNVEHLHAPIVRFDDIPFEMQNGIIARFELELFNNSFGKGKDEYVAIAEQYKSQIVKLFAELDEQIIKFKQKL